MKLNLVADYELCGKRFASIFSIDGSNNLVNLPEMTKMLVHFSDGPSAYIKPKFLLMCKSGAEAERVRSMWNDGYRRDGRLFDFSHMTYGEFCEYEKGSGVAE